MMQKEQLVALRLFKICNLIMVSEQEHGRLQGRARGGTCILPPWPAKIVWFSTFRKEKSMFLSFFALADNYKQTDLYKWTEIQSQLEALSFYISVFQTFLIHGILMEPINN
jgi:hypothetical protein